MKCTIVFANHKDCPPGTPCHSDPAGVMDDHSKTVVYTGCENEAEINSEFCTEHKNYYKETK